MAVPCYRPSGLGLYRISPSAEVWSEAISRGIFVGALLAGSLDRCSMAGCIQNPGICPSARLQSLLTNSQTIIFVKDLDGGSSKSAISSQVCSSFRPKR